ncbi:MAG: hypothetical protein HUU21_03210 [Polyangiaceae bacterium]|nr:hypothetical protein [Polyangiaceae bacterium]
MGAAAPRLQWEPELLSRIVADELERLAARSERGPLTRYRAAAEPLYALPPSDREAAFYELDLGTVAMLELDRVPLAEIERAKWHPKSIHEVLIGPAAVAREEGADLTPHQRTRVVMRLRPSRFGDRENLAAFLAHELGHISDLIAPEFGYSGDRLVPTAGSSEHLVRDRYRAMWCASIDLRRKRIPAPVREERVRAVLKAFGIDDRDAASVGRWLSDPIPHATLLSCAENPRHLAEVCPGLRGRPDAARTRCPICKLPAFPACPPADDLHQAVQSAIRADVPGWSPSDGTCQRCREIYIVLGGVSQ